VSLFRSKAEQKLLDKGLDPARLPPGQYLTEKWPVLHAGTVPQTDLATWDFKVFGEVEEPLTLDYDERQALESVRHVVQGRALARAREARATQAERALRPRACGAGLHRQRATRGARKRQRPHRLGGRRPPTRGRARLAAAACRALALLLEERQVAAGHRASLRRSAGLLGAARL